MNHSPRSRSVRSMTLSLALLGLGACGAAATPQSQNRDPSYVEVHVAPFHATLPAGTVVALDDAGLITIDGEAAGHLRADGRVESGEGETLAALLPDGRISFAGALTDARIVGARLIESDVAILELAQDRSLTLRLPDGRTVATVPVIGIVPASRATALFVVSVHLLMRAHVIEEQAGALVAEGEASGVLRVRVPVEGRPSRGPDDAPVTIAMFSDFECPFCSRAAGTMSELHRRYGDRVRFVFLHNPLPFHMNATDAAVVAEEAFAQRGADAFWAMHDVLFANQRALGPSELARYAAAAGLDRARVDAALDEGPSLRAVQADMQLAQSVGARGTPTFFVNGIPITGAQPVSVFADSIDRELARVALLVERGVPPRAVYASLMSAARDRIPEEAGAPVGQPRRTADPSAVYRVPVGSAPARGAADALVTMVVFSDFQCPFCSRVTPTIEALEQRYGRDLRIVFRHNPLPFHHEALPAAEAASEALAQGGADAFWRMHDRLFADQDALGREDLERHAAELGLDLERFRRALDRHTHRAAIEADQALARQLGSSGTPAFFINGRNLRGAQPIAAFEALIDEELARARALVASGTARADVYDALIRNGATEPVLLAPTEGAAADTPEADRAYDLPVPPRAPSRGAARAPLTIQIFSDFQCPFCARVRPTIERVLEAYAGRVRIVWRNYPLPFHADARPAAEAAMEIFAQRGADAFWQFHDILFENQRALDRASLEQYAQQIRGIDLRRFRAALDDHRHLAAIDADMEAVRAAGAEIGTPSFFIGDRLLQGAQPFESFQRVIDRQLADAPTGR